MADTDSIEGARLRLAEPGFVLAACTAVSMEVHWAASVALHEDSEERMWDDYGLEALEMRKGVSAAMHLAASFRDQKSCGVYRT